MNVRGDWLDRLLRVCEPVLQAAAEGRLRQAMTLQVAAEVPSTSRPIFPLEAMARSLAGIAPWLALDPDSLDADERALHERLTALALTAVRNMFSPDSPDSVDTLPDDPQILAEAAVLSLALLRAPNVLWARLDTDSQHRLLAWLRDTRRIRLKDDNWLLFPAMVEAALQVLSGKAIWQPIRRGLRGFRYWYAGDGMYRDGAMLRCDYYNSYIIQPMLLMLAKHAPRVHTRPPDESATLLRRAQRHAEILERLIAPDGTFPPLGRSLAYRCGAFHLLAQLAWEKRLPARLAPAQVRSALTAVIKRTLDAPGTFDAKGWLTIGLAGHQPGIAERYISTGSLYLCTTAFLPLGLPPDDPFWTMPDQEWTSKRAFSGRPFAIDTALEG